MNKDKIIVALDVATAEEAREIFGELGGTVGAFKIGLQLFTAAGASFVREAVAAGNKIFLDLKFHDIPNTTAKASIEAARLGVWMFNVHAAGGAEMMRRTVGEVEDVCAKENLQKPKIIGVTVLTSSNQATLHETGIESITEKQVLRLAALAETSGLDGVVAAPLEIELIRAAARTENFLIVTPGIRNREPKSEDRIVGTSDDQKRVMTAADAIKAGAGFLVIGRPITEANDRMSAVRTIIGEIEAAGNF